MITNYSRLAVTSLVTDNILIRKASLADTLAIAALVNLGEREGQLLARSIESVRATIGDWLVAEADGAVVVGVGALIEMGPKLVEVRSLAVLPNYRKKGLGARIVGSLLEEATARGYAQVFALTRAVAFFERLGFSVTVKEEFPEKVWRDCIICPVRFACDEVALVWSPSVPSGTGRSGA
jgi:amino-acid N-acetyltransferase